MRLGIIETWPAELPNHAVDGMSPPKTQSFAANRCRGFTVTLGCIKPAISFYSRTRDNQGVLHEAVCYRITLDLVSQLLLRSRDTEVINTRNQLGRSVGPETGIYSAVIYSRELVHSQKRQLGQPSKSPLRVCRHVVVLVEASDGRQAQRSDSGQQITPREWYQHRNKERQGESMQVNRVDV